MAGDDKKHIVVVSPLALTTMLVHAGRNGAACVHGILVGTFSADTVRVTGAIPVCHEAPTKPLVDTALNLVDGVVVGWYTAPERLQDEKPGAPALRIAASLAANTQGEPVLMVLQSEAVAECLGGDTTKTEVVKVYGKDFGQQWMESLELLVESEVKALEAARQAHKDKVVLHDLVDHWEGDSAAADWFPNAAIAKWVERSL